MADSGRNEREDRALGLDVDITRRDFLNAGLLGTGMALLAARAPGVLAAGKPAYAGVRVGDDWYGYGGVGDYAPSHGNTPEVVNNAHEIRDGLYSGASLDAVDTGEAYDLVVVGGGFAGMGAAYTFMKDMGGTGKKCLILENHPVFGGEAKRNEFVVDGQRLIAPQGSNGLTIPDPEAGGERGAFASGDDEWYFELRMPTDVRYQRMNTEKYPEVEFVTDNYVHNYWMENKVDIGYFFPGAPGEEARFVRNPWKTDFRDAPLPEEVKRDINRWRTDRTRPRHPGDDFRPWLDSMSYQQYMENVMGVNPEVTKLVHATLASGIGLGCDAISAYGAYALGMPGVLNFYDVPAVITRRDAFPGGNDTILRYFVKRLIPGAIAGGDSLEDIALRNINFDALDRPGQPVRMRLRSTVVRVQHAGGASPESSDHVEITYKHAERLYRVKAKAVVMATGGWVNKHAIRDLPEPLREAYATFIHAPVLMVNVGLTNWRAMAKLGISAARWFDGVGESFGFSCNIRQPMIIGDYQPPLDPDRPTVLNFHVPFFYPGMDPKAQGIRGRMEMLMTSYADFERRIRKHLVALFGRAGFDPKRDVAAIILNRWGHAYVCPTPGFYFGRDGKPAARDVIRQGYGRVAFAHAELHGNQHWGPAAMEGRRAALQLKAALG